MVDRHTRFKPSQVAVLRWIADGCPHGVMHGHSYRTTALALQDQRLVTVSRNGGNGRATITEGGRYHLEHGAYADPPVDHGRVPAVDDFTLTFQGHDVGVRVDHSRPLSRSALRCSVAVGTRGDIDTVPTGWSSLRRTANRGRVKRTLPGRARDAERIPRPQSH